MDDPIPLLPNLIIIGAQKSGTTTLHESLRRHPSIEMTSPKELDVFCWPDWKRRLDRYDGQFSGDALIRGEGTPVYLHDPQGPEKFREAGMEELRLLCILRHPTDRAYSHYWHSIRNGHETASFPEALEREPHRIAESFEMWRSGSYLTRGFYDVFLDRYQHAFGDRLLVIGFDDLRHDHPSTLRRVYRFLGVDADVDTPGDLVRANPARLPRSRAAARAGRLLRRHGLGIPARAIDRVNLRTATYPPIDPGIRAQLDDVFSESMERVRENYGVHLDRRDDDPAGRPSRLIVAARDTPSWSNPIAS